MCAYYSEEGPAFAGLGAQQQPQTDEAGGGDRGAGTAAFTVQAFLDECMAHHERQQQQQSLNQHQYLLWNADRSTDAPPHHPGGAPAAMPYPQPTAAYSLEESTKRAQAVLERWREQTPPAKMSSSDVATSWPSRAPTMTCVVIPPEEFRRRREAGLAGEAHRRWAATLRNFEYLTARHERKLAALDHHIAQRRRVEEQLQAAQERALDQQRRQQQVQPQGLPVHQQPPPPLGPRRHPSQQVTAATNSEDTVALYISGVPTTAAASAHDATTALLTGLFAEFGTLRRIHLYRDKQTRALKGDGLVIFDWRGADGDRDRFIGAVCAQRNGVQFPDGSVLVVEPARSNTQQTPSDYYGKGAASEINDTSAKEAIHSHFAAGIPGNSFSVPQADQMVQSRQQGDDSQDELDEFFASIE